MMGTSTLQELMGYAREGGIDELARESGVFHDDFSGALRDFFAPPAPLPSSGSPALAVVVPSVASCLSPVASALPAPSMPPPSPKSASPAILRPPGAKRGPGRPPKRPREDEDLPPRKAKRGGKTGPPSSAVDGATEGAGEKGKAPGLRHFSTLVCKKVETRRVTTYNEVADELVAEGSVCGESGAPPSGTAADQNIRRRVYDVLNVLIALGVITKEKKSIRWVGLPPSASDETARLSAERAVLEDQVRKKQERLTELAVQRGLYTELIRRNREAPETPERRVTLPFIAVHTRPTAFIQCEVAADYSEVFLNFNQPFEICDDIELLRYVLTASEAKAAPHPQATPPGQIRGAPSSRLQQAAEEEDDGVPEPTTPTMSAKAKRRSAVI